MMLTVIGFIGLPVSRLMRFYTKNIQFKFWTVDYPTWKYLGQKLNSFLKKNIWKNSFLCIILDFCKCCNRYMHNIGDTNIIIRCYYLFYTFKRLTSDSVRQPRRIYIRCFNYPNCHISASEKITFPIYYENMVRNRI